MGYSLFFVRNLTYFWMSMISSVLQWPHKSKFSEIRKQERLECTKLGIFENVNCPHSWEDAHIPQKIRKKLYGSMKQLNMCPVPSFHVSLGENKKWENRNILFRFIWPKKNHSSSFSAVILLYTSKKSCRWTQPRSLGAKARKLKIGW